MTDHTPPAHPVPGVVIAHCGDLSGGRLERRLRECASSVPDGVRLIATVLSRPKLSPSIAQRVEIAVISDGGAALIEHEVVTGVADVVVVPFGVHVAGGWWPEVQRRAAGAPEDIGVLMVGTSFMFVFPAQVTSMDAGRTALLPVDGVSSGRRAGVTTRPTLGAVLIVKDEERRLGKCLAALTGVVDQVVVYDTGSSDATVAIARDLGVEVVEGFWDDDFSAARNRALDHCTTQWVLSVDADEVVTADRGLLLDWLAAVNEDLCLVQLVSTTTEDGTDGLESRLSRLFRRERTVWKGALHEQPVGRDGLPLLMCPQLPPLRIVHSGYTVGHEKSEEKADRNLRISERVFRRTAVDDPAWPHITVDYARSQALAGKYEEMLATVALLEGREMSPALTVQLASSVIPLVMSPEKVAAAEHWTDRAEAAGDSVGATALRRAQIKGLRGDAEGAVTDLERLVGQSPEEHGFDLWGKGFDAMAAVLSLAQAYSGTGEPARAAEVMTRLMTGEPDRVPVADVLTTVRAAGTPLVDLAARAPEAFVSRSVLEVPAVAADLALDWYKALLSARPDDSRALVIGSAAAARSSLDDALEWSVLSREAGRGAEVCALRWLAEGDVAHRRTRALAWAVLVHGFQQHHDADRLRDALDHLDADDTADVLSALQRVAPEVTSFGAVRSEERLPTAAIG